MGNEIRNRILRGLPGISLPRYEIDIAKGIVEGRTPVRRYGHNLACGATEETIWCMSNLYVYLTSAEQLKVKSSAVATDIPTSTGAWTVFIKGLDTNYNIITETVTLENPGPVTTIQSFLRVFIARVMTAGTGGKNAGNISVNDNADAVTLGYIPIGENQSHAALWTVPKGQRFIWLGRQGGEIAAKQSHILFYIREYGSVWQLKRDVVVKDSHFYTHMAMPWSIPAKADIEVRAVATGGSGIVFGGFAGYREDVKW
ncbi:MAG: hypothetical protein KAV87_06185 [Desulfobacteraceae bacterium]|nr:hypothetical protein [Desulfobacteraceae bacterium]